MEVSLRFLWLVPSGTFSFALVVGVHYFVVFIIYFLTLLFFTSPFFTLASAFEVIPLPVNNHDYYRYFPHNLFIILHRLSFYDTTTDTLTILSFSIFYIVTRQKMLKTLLWPFRILSLLLQDILRNQKLLESRWYVGVQMCREIYLSAVLSNFQRIFVSSGIHDRFFIVHPLFRFICHFLCRRIQLSNKRLKRAHS